MPSAEETRAMQEIMDKLNNATSAKPAKTSQSQQVTGNVSPDAQEMYNILHKLQNVTEEGAKKLVKESSGPDPIIIQDKEQAGFGFGDLNVVMRKSSVYGYKKTFYTVMEGDEIVAEDLANKSTSLLSLSVECAFTQFQLISNSLAKISSSVQRSLFLTSCLFAVFHPFFFQLCIHSVIPDLTYLESVKIWTLLPFGIFLSASIGANNSIWLFVVSFLLPFISVFFPSSNIIAAQPPLPGLPMHEPSVYILIINSNNLYKFLNCCVLWAFDNILLDLLF